MMKYCLYILVVIGLCSCDSLKGKDPVLVANEAAQAGDLNKARQILEKAVRNPEHRYLASISLLEVYRGLKLYEKAWITYLLLRDDFNHAIPFTIRRELLYNLAISRLTNDWEKKMLTAQFQFIQSQEKQDCLKITELARQGDGKLKIIGLASLAESKKPHIEEPPQESRVDAKKWLDWVNNENCYSSHYQMAGRVEDFKVLEVRVITAEAYITIAEAKDTHFGVE
jgi:hypothetical protein